MLVTVKGNIKEISVTGQGNTLAEALRQQTNKGLSPAEAIRVALEISPLLQSGQGSQISRRGIETTLPADIKVLSQAVTTAWAAMSLVEYARLLRLYSGSAMELASALYSAISPHPSATEMCRALLDAQVYPQTGREEMQNILKACGYSDADISQALKSCFPDSKPVIVEVQAAKPWQATGVRIGTGEKAVIEYQSGTWRISPAIPACDANGSSIYTAKNGYAMPGKPEGGLLGRIGDKVFWVGKRGETPSGVAGELQLCTNDDLESKYGEGLKDNSGKLKVKIIVLKINA